MYYQKGINTVFRRYNTTVVVAFIVIILVAFSAASLRYFNQLAQHKQQSLLELKQEAQQLNNMLEQSVQAVVGIHEFAEYILKHPNELNIPMPALLQQGQMFYLNKPLHDVIKQGKRLSSNITGIGQVAEFSEAKKQEIAMANALTPAFIAAQNIIAEATWFYYVSFSGFVNIYPWVDREVWQFNHKTLNSSHNQAIQTLTSSNNRVLWSPPYLDAAGGGMNASLGTGVFHHDKLLGAVVIDVNLSRLHAGLTELESTDQGFILYNQNNDILLAKRWGKESLSYRVSWQDLLPKSLQGLNAERLSKLGDAERFGDWFIEKQVLSVNGWTLLKYQNYDSFAAPQYSDFVFVFAMLFIGLLAFLMLVNTMTKRTFIKPTTEFISHIQYCAEGDPGKITPAADWLHWFQVVEDIFVQNRSLLLQLTEQNDVLDSRVIEKTKALQETSAQHQRDYALLRSVMNAIPELIVFNDPDGLLMGCNKAFERLTNHSVEQMLGIKSSTFMPTALAQEVNRLNARCNDIYPQQALIKAGDYIYQGFCNQFTDEQGNILGTISIFHDVTLQQATQSALEKAKDQAEYANKVKIQFLANMSHEVRTPINAMQGMMDLLAHTSLDTRQQHYLVNAQGASATLLHLVDELLDLSKIEAGKMVVSQDVVNLPVIIDKALKLNLSNVDHKRVEVLVDMSAQVPSNVISDEMRLVQVLANLFNNAIKFTEQGEIKLIVDLLSTTDSVAQVRFRVIDTGIGIASDNQSHLFKAFSQADESMTRKYGGSGLGLSICQQIINLLGGEISLTSQLGQGCELSFVLPLQRAPLACLNKVNSEPLFKSNHKVTEVSFSLAAELSQPLIAGISIYAINQKLSTSLVESIAQMSWLLHEVSSVDDLLQLDVVDNSVLLISEVDFIAQQNRPESISSLAAFRLLGLCQPALTQLSNETCSHLDKLSTAYLLVDKPLFRYSLDQISQALIAQAESFAEQAKSDTSLVYQQHSNKKTVRVTAQKPSMLKDEQSLQGVSVLLVEDNLVNQLVAKELLLNMHAKVTIADNGQRAIDTLAEQHFDVVLMDIQMPIMDGLTAAKLIRAQSKYKNLPIVAMTAHAREEDKQQSLAAGMNLHMPKPVTGQALLTCIKKVLREVAS
ncbi:MULTISPECIES: PAS domain-containing hybrid sensor histidine kinase/response regulator [Colwellia]|uniref:histidine kinase n=1 Tax=Colwellia marinimaniae TaxID=1513592 RepID=A0ABQ0MQ22_9GAMM|nr:MULTISPECIES: PAS domain-containing hybrid sensor histidine kinase/response regulator [Colwellia]GAW94468.1 histidine kinase [Colwellia marinimaniae]